MLLMRYCHIPRCNHLARTVSPSQLMPAATLHDQLSRTTFQQLVRCFSLGSDQWLQATLPIRNGGFGMTSISSSCGTAFVSSWAMALVHLPSCFPDLNHYVGNITQDKEVLPGSIGSELRKSLPQGKCLSDLMLNTKRLQHKLSQDQNREIVQSIQDNSQSLQSQC